MEVNMIDINKAEKYFKNNGYVDIIEGSKPFCARYTSMNVWGNNVVWLDISNPERIQKKRNKLKTYKVDVEIGKNETDINAIKEKFVDKKKKKNLEMFGGITDREKLLNLTCNQLCEWRWLEDEKGQILFETHRNGDVVYTAHLVKYAVVLDADGNPIDPEIKEIK